jgi:hypothetical protein
MLMLLTHHSRCVTSQHQICMYVQCCLAFAVRRIIRCMCRRCINKWQQYLVYTGYPDSGLFDLLAAHDRCGTRTSEAACNGTPAPSEATPPPPRATPPPVLDNTPTPVPPPLLEDSGLINAGRCAPDAQPCTAEFDKCAGNEITTAKPCCNGFVCVRKSEYYAQCRDLTFLRSPPAGWSGELVNCTEA